MKKVYDRIVDMRGNLITVIAHGVSLGELARIHKRNGRSTYASVLRIEDEVVTLQCFENTRGIATNDRVSFLGRQMQAVCGDSILGRRLNGAGGPIDGGPEIIAEKRSEIPAEMSIAGIGRSALRNSAPGTRNWLTSR